MLLGETTEDYDRHFILTNDIDLDPNLPGRKVFDGAVIAPDVNDDDRWFQGTAFTGLFDGNGHTISHLTITGDSYLGLFGQLGSGANISNLGLDAVDVKGTGGSVGGLVGSIGEWDSGGGIVANCYSTGMVSGEWDVGGLVGSNYYGNITMNYSTGTVTGEGTCGGLIGYNYKGSVTSCYSSCAVTHSGSRRSGTGGLIGHHDRGIITASYSTGTVTGEHHVGGLVGWNESNASITASYSTGSVSDGGGLVGFNEDLSLTSSSFWDIETSGQMGSDGGFGLTTIEMMDPEMLGLHGLLTNDPNWVLDAGRDYPRLAWEGTAGQIIPEPVIDWLDGQGTEEEPYRIDTADQLILFGRAGMLWDKYFILGADINLDPNLQGGRVFSRAVITSFDGVFDGNDHTISHLTISGDDYLGLFGQLGSGATISNLALEAVNVNGGFCVGGLVGHSNDSNISNCYCTGVVAGEMNVGGLAGDNVGNIANCYSSGTVAATESVGGLVGDNHGIITTCYSTGSVTGYEDVGGLVGRNDDAAAATIATITMSYSTGAVTGDRTVGGLVGSNSNGGSITMSYSTGAVTGNNDVGGLVGEIDGSITASYWDIQASGEPNMCGNAEDPSCDNSYGKTTAEMQTESTFTEAGWDFVGETVNGPNDIWKIVEGQTYPLLSWQKYGGGTGEPNDPYLLYTAEHLNELGAEPNDYDKHFKLMVDIDLSGYTYGRAVIGNFTGVFDGNGHTISHMTIVGEEDLGLFGELGYGAMVSNLGLDAVDINGTSDNIGSLAGYNEGHITQSYSTGTVIGDDEVGGLVGFNKGSITNSYSDSTVSGNDCIGGLVGENGGSITSSCSTGSVLEQEREGPEGGLVGFWFIFYGEIVGSTTKSFWDMETSGLTESAGGIGKTTAEMQTASTFLEAGWDFVDETANGTDDIWWILEAQDYPRLWWELIASN